jgi:hypothetical protein
MSLVHLTVTLAVPSTCPTCRARSPTPSVQQQAAATLGLPVDSPAATDFAQKQTDVVEHARQAMSNAQHRECKYANLHRRPKHFK